MDQKVVFITGASRGIGAATVKKFAEKGWRVAGFYNKTQIANDQVTNYYQMNVEDPESIKSAFEKAFSDFGRVDCLVNDVGAFGASGIANYTVEKMDLVYRLNERSAYLCTQKIVEWLKEGTIVNISSSAAEVGSTDPIYAAAKAGILGFTKSMAKALAPKIRVNCVAPGVVDTDMLRGYYDAEKMEKRRQEILLKEVAKPEYIAEGIYFLASDEARHITGATLDINGGYVLR